MSHEISGAKIFCEPKKELEQKQILWEGENAANTQF
jgi:hypothetical protein